MPSCPHFGARLPKVTATIYATINLASTYTLTKNEYNEFVTVLGYASLHAL